MGQFLSGAFAESMPASGLLSHYDGCTSASQRVWPAQAAHQTRLWIPKHAYTDAQTLWFRILPCESFHISVLSPRTLETTKQPSSTTAADREVTLVALAFAERFCDFSESLEVTGESALEAGKQRRWQRKELPCSLTTMSLSNVSRQNLSPGCFCGRLHKYLTGMPQ